MHFPPARLNRLIAETDRHVPFYRAHWTAAGVHAGALRFPQGWSRLPTVRKADFLAADRAARIDERYAQRPLLSEKTSGSSAEPFEMLMDLGARRRRRWRFLRALLAAGCRPGRPVMLIAERSSTPWALRAMGWRYVALHQGEAALAEAYLSQRPAALYGPLSALIALGDRLAHHHPGYPHPRRVIATAEELTTSQRGVLRELFAAPVADFYGMTEFGLMLWRPEGQRTYRAVSADLLLEYLPCREDPQLERLVVTDLAGGAMPLIRYETGDLVRREGAGPDAPIVRLAGREIDCLRLPSGQRISPYRITLSLEAIPGVEQYQVIQNPNFTIDAFVRAAPEHAAQAFAEVEATLRRVCGDELALQVHPFPDRAPSRSGKLRPVCSRLGASA